MDKCIKSIQSQTLQDFELILVNDGSKDNSLEICKKYSQEDSRIIVFNQENSGQSKARNVGLENANGEYVAFLDSDDWVDSDYYERLVVACEKNEAEVSCGSILRVRKNYQKYRIKYTEEKVYTKSQEKIDIAHVPDMCYVWNKVYKKEFLDRINLKFVEGMFFEDVDFVTRAVYFSNKIVTVPDTYYHYWTNWNSTVKTMKISDKKRADSLRSKEMVLKFFKEHNLKSKWQMQIHDELSWSFNLEDGVETLFAFKKIMEDWDDGLVPVIADMEITTSTWNSKKEVETIDQVEEIIRNIQDNPCT